MSIVGAKADAGQVLVVGFPAGDLPGPLRDLAGAGALGGFVLFRRNLGSARETSELLAQLVAACRRDLPPWIAVDQEGGRVARLGEPVLRLPPMRALGQLGDTELTYEAASLLGRQLRAYGFTLDFAPVLDVDTNPANPVIGDRAFATTPEGVISQAGAFARGLAASGVAACGKHFPGHGDTVLDSHLALPRLEHPMSRLEAIELRPFAELCSELPCIMSAHVIFDAIDATRPATLSRAVITGVLRERLGFSGVIFSDDLEMKAIAEHHGVAEGACAAIDAGCDTLLICSKPELALSAHEALTRKAEQDPRFAARLREAAARSLSARRKYFVEPTPPERIEQSLRAEAPERLEARIAAAREGLSA